MAYIITHNYKLATMKELYSLNEGCLRDSNIEDDFIVGKTKKSTIEKYIHHFGFTWQERPEMVEINRIEIVYNYSDKD